MTGALAVRDDMPDLLGTAPADLVDDDRPPAVDFATARRRAARIRRRLATYTEMRQDIADAYACRDWAVLGYGSWYRYLEGEFAAELQQLAHSRNDRRQAVADLRGQGLSTRQIGAVTGVDAKTVRNDLAGAPAPDAVTGTDGKTYPARHPSQGATTPAAGTAGDGIPADPASAANFPQGAAGDAHPDRPGSPDAGVEQETAAAFPIGCRVEWETHAAAAAGAGEVRTIYPGGRALWVIDDRGIGRTVAPGRAHLVSSPGSHPADSPAGRDPQAPAFESGEAGSAAVATPGQPGEDDAEVRFHRDRRRRIRIAHDVEQLAAVLADLWVAAEVEPDEIPLFALLQQRDDLDRLIRRLETTAAPAPEGTP